LVDRLQEQRRFAYPRRALHQQGRRASDSRLQEINDRLFLVRSANNPRHVQQDRRFCGDCQRNEFLPFATVSATVRRCDGATNVNDVITVEDVRRITAGLPRSYEVVVRDQIKFRVGSLVYAAFSRDETVIGVGFPKEERAAMVAAEPDKFMLPRNSDMRYNWIHVRLDAIDLDEVRELVIDAWRMCVPKKVAAELS